MFCWNITHCISLTPRKNTISAIFTVLFCFLSPTLATVIKLLRTLLNNNLWPKDNLTKFRRLLKQCSVFYLRFCLLGRIPARICQNSCHYKASRLLCSINAISSPSCVFKLQNPVVIHCLISPLKVGRSGLLLRCK